MITIRKIKIDIDKDTNELLSRLKWQIHPVDNLIFARTSAFSLDSIKPLIGKLDKINLRFSLTRIRPPFQNFLPQILMYGILIPKGAKSEIQLKFKFGIFTTTLFLFLIYSTGQIIWQTVDEMNSSDEFLNEIIWLLIFPVGAVILTLYEIQKVKEKVFEILAIDEIKQNAR